MPFVYLARWSVAAAMLCGLSCAQGEKSREDEVQCMAGCGSAAYVRFEPSIRQPGDYVISVGSRRCSLTLEAQPECRVYRDLTVIPEFPKGAPHPRALYPVEIWGNGADYRCGLGGSPELPACLTLRDISLPLPGPSPPGKLHVSIARDGVEVINGEAKLEEVGKPYRVCGQECAHSQFTMPIPPGPLRSF